MNELESWPILPVAETLFEETSAWNERFFESFNRFRNDLYGGRVPSQPESRDDLVLEESIASLKAQFEPNAPFSERHDWRAWIARNPSGRVIGRVLASFPKDGSADFVACGYFECVNSPIVARELLERAARFGRECAERFPSHQLELRAPVQGSFFNGYRIRLSGGSGQPFYGEPRYPDYYHALFKSAGLVETSRWKTWKITRPGTEQAFSRIWERTRAWWRTSGLKVRALNLKRWDEELKIVHSLLTASYRSMSCYAPISFPEFKALYDSFRRLVHPDLVFFVEQDGKPLGFMIAMFDPLPILLAHEQSALRDSKVGRLLTLFRLKRNKKKLLVMYTGKLPRTRARWIVAGLGWQLARRVSRWNVHEALVCYVAEGSGTHLSLPADRTFEAEYALYARPL